MNVVPRPKHLLAIIFAAASCASMAKGINTEISGFARIVAGQLNDSGVSYSDYDNSFTIDQDSLLGLQGKVDFNEKLSATALGLLHSNDDESGLEWFYLTYHATNVLDIKIGQMQTPFYSLSDSLDVGYSYPWVKAPREIYNDSVFKTFQGVDARYTLLFDNATMHIEAYYGSFDGDIDNAGEELKTEVDDMRGLIGELRISNFSFRTSFHEGDVDLEFDQTAPLEQALSVSGFQRSADSINPDGKSKFYQVSAEYDSLSYFLKSEWARIETDPDFLPEIQGYYLTYGHYFNKITALITYARTKDTNTEAIDEIPLGLDPALDELSFIYQSVYGLRPQDDIESLSLGLRWDFKTNFALKTEYKIIESSTTRSYSFIVEDGVNFDQKSSLLLVGLEWVF